MSTMKLLVKDRGHEGLTVHGITNLYAVAQAWESGDTLCRCIDTDEDASVSPEPLQISERI